MFVDGHLQQGAQGRACRVIERLRASLKPVCDAGGRTGARVPVAPLGVTLATASKH